MQYPPWKQHHFRKIRWEHQSNCWSDSALEEALRWERHHGTWPRKQTRFWVFLSGDVLHHGVGYTSISDPSEPAYGKEQAQRSRSISYLWLHPCINLHTVCLRIFLLEHGATQGVGSICNPTFESISNGFLPKEAPFNFLPLTYNGDWRGLKIELTLDYGYQNS